MKQFLSTLIILLTFLLPSVGWGEVDKKGLICQCIKCYSYKLERGYWFENGKLKGRLFGERQDSVITIEGNELSFSTTPDQVFWYNTFQFQLNRQTLILDTLSNGELITRSNCQVFNRPEYERIWEKLKNKHQISYNQKLKKNKI